LNEQFVYPSSPLAFLASLRTSIIQARNRTTGATVNNIPKSDVNNPLPPRFSEKIHLCEPVSQPDATGFSGAETDAIEADATVPADNFAAEHSSAGPAVAPGRPVAVPNRPQAASDSKSARA
jgi:hypothetical protein